MRSAKQLLALLICLLLSAPAVPAQDAQQGAAKASSDVTIIIQQEQVRFAAQRAVAEMRLQVFDQAGELVYDSGAILESELNWPLQNGNGGALKSGLYAYTLSLKEAGQEPGKETTRVRRGHFIVDRAQERDGADKLWVTSQNNGGVGADLTVARDEHATVAGATIGGERILEQRAVNADRDSNERKVAGEKQAANKSNAAAASTAGRIAKFTGGNNELGDSVITEQNGSIGIGTATPQARLHVNGGVRFDSAGKALKFSSGTEVDIFSDTNSVVIQSSGNRANNHVILNPFGPGANGNVGIGLFGPQAKLHVNGGVRFENAGKVLSFQTGTEFDMLSPTSSVVIQSLGQRANNHVILNPFPNTGPGPFHNGNVGIGTFGPEKKLHVEGQGEVEVVVRSRNERAILSLENTLGPARYAWTLESGVRGQPGVFGIYNRVVNRSGLEIDGNLRVYVKELQITGGADFAENFDVRAETPVAIQPGMVVAIDPARPGKLELSRRAYDRRVAGIISGAGDVKPGMMMGAAGTLADGQHPVALSGRVYVWVDAARGAVKPGDLLTTSATPGHAMKASNTQRAQGAIIGKAMTGLQAGKGLVLVLVTLQ